MYLNLFIEVQLSIYWYHQIEGSVTHDVQGLSQVLHSAAVVTFHSPKAKFGKARPDEAHSPWYLCLQIDCLFVFPRRSVAGF